MVASRFTLPSVLQTWGPEVPYTVRWCSPGAMSIGACTTPASDGIAVSSMQITFGNGEPASKVSMSATVSCTVVAADADGTADAKPAAVMVATAASAKNERIRMAALQGGSWGTGTLTHTRDPVGEAGPPNLDRC